VTPRFVLYFDNFAAITSKYGVQSYNAGNPTAAQCVLANVASVLPSYGQTTHAIVRSQNTSVKCGKKSNDAHKKIFSISYVQMPFSVLLTCVLLYFWRKNDEHHICKLPNLFNKDILTINICRMK